MEADIHAREGKYCKFMTTRAHNLPAGAMPSKNLSEEERELALLGDSEEVPERDSPEYVPFLEALIGLLTVSVKKLELSAEVKDKEDKVLSLFARYKSLERMLSMDNTSPQGGQQSQSGVNTSQHQQTCSSPPQWASVADMIGQAG